MTPESRDGTTTVTYAYLAERAHALEDGNLTLSNFVWDEDGDWSKERVFAVDAITAHVSQEGQRVRDVDDEEEQADLNDGHAYLPSSGWMTRRTPS